jgi:hypothetical protein
VDGQTIRKIAIEMSSPTIGVREAESGRHAGRAYDDGKAGDAVDACVVAVDLERRRAGSAPGADAVDRHPLVADEPDQAGQRRREQVRGRLRVDEPVDRLVRGKASGEQDDRDDGHAGEVLRPPVAIGHAPRRGPAAEHESGGERDRRQRIADVVNAVGEQCHRAREHHEDDLKGGGEGEDAQGKAEGAHGLAAAQDAGVDAAMAVSMAVLAGRVPVPVAVATGVFSQPRAPRRGAGRRRQSIPGRRDRAGGAPR